MSHKEPLVKPSRQNSNDTLNSGPLMGSDYTDIRFIAYVSLKPYGMN